MMQQSAGKGQPKGLLRRQYIAQQQTMPQPIALPPQPGTTFSSSGVPNTPLPFSVIPTIAPIAALPIVPKQRRVPRIFAIFLVLGLSCAVYFVWFTTSPQTATSSSAGQQSFSPSTSSSPSTSDAMKVYVVGAVKNPGMYALPAGARVYDLVQAAGGPLPKANLVAINLAAKLNDGQEVYITLVGETPPTYVGGVSGTAGGTTQLVNINTASVDELSQGLHISKKSAQAIVDYRTQHGNFPSVDQLAQVVSGAMYNKIKAQCTV